MDGPEGPSDGGPATTTHQQTFFPDQPSGHRKGLSVPHRLPVIYQGTLQDLGNKVISDSLNCISFDNVPFGVCEERAFWINT